MFFRSLILATGNRFKYKEFSELLPKGLVGELLFAPSLRQGSGILEVEETGTTYAMNAFLKAQAWARAFGVPSLADDSGLEAEALSWRPGIRSARIVEGSDADRNRWLLSQMEGQENRRASFVAAVALSVPFVSDRSENLGGGEWTMVCEGMCKGRLGTQETGEQGFGYDPLFIPDGYDVSFGELPSATKNKISHRTKALQALI